MNLTPARRHLAFCALILATVIAVLDISAINLALPTIAGSLGLTVGDALWLSKANLLSCAVTILPCAALGDVLGHRRIFSAGLLVFALAATGCALSSDLGLLISLRTVQGCASAAIMCSSLVLLREIFPPRMLGTALGLNALFVAVATTAGPAISGLILALLSWRWLFALGPPLALGALSLGLAYLPEKRSANSRFDLLGALLLIGTAMVLLGGYLNGQTPLAALLSLVLAITFFQHQRHTRWPLLPLKVFSNLRFDYALSASVIAFIGQSSAFIALPLMFQQLMGHSPLAAAGLFIPWPLMTALVGPFAGKCADQGNPRAVASVGMAIFALGLAALALLPDAASPVDIMWRIAICGVGFGFFQSPNNREILTNVLPAHAARAAALLSAARLTGQALGAMLVGMVFIQAHPPQPLYGLDRGPVAQLLWYAGGLQIAALLLNAVTWRAARKQPSHLTRPASEDL